MRHRKSGRKLGRTQAHRRALLSNLATSLFRSEAITTTLPKAKELRSFAERLITKARQDNLHARRQCARVLHDKVVLAKLFSELSPRYAERPGGYTRIYKLGPRRGDNAEMALIELVDRPSIAASAASEGGGRKLVERDDDAGGDDAGDSSSKD
ncbi:MAG: 50S ribosomal protein L17 [Acidobacteriota bacterium]